MSCLLSPFLQPLSLRLNLLFFLSSLFLFFLLPVPGPRLVFLAWPTQLKTLLLRLLVRLVSVITCRYCVILQRKPTKLPAPRSYGTLLAYHGFSVDVLVCPGGPSPGLVRGPSPRSSHSTHSRPITQAGGHASDICGATIRNPLQRPACPPACPSRYQCSLYLGIICLPGQDETRVATLGRAWHCSIAGRRDLMSPSLPDIAIDALSPSHSSLVCIIRQTDIAAAAAVATAPVAVAVATSPPTQSWAKSGG